MDKNTLEAIDLLAQNIAGVMHKLFGFAYSENTEHFTYQKTFDSTVNYAVGDVITRSINFTQESDFVCTRINCNARFLAHTTAVQVGNKPSNANNIAVAGSNDGPVPFEVELLSGGSDRNLQNESVDADLCFGEVGGLPGILSKPRLFKRNSNLTMKVTLLKAAANATVDILRCRVALIGWKVYDLAALDLTTRRP